MNNCFGIWLLSINFAPTILRGGAVVARWAHNPKVGGSNPPSATNQKPWRKAQGFFVYSPKKACFLKGWEQKNLSRVKRGRAFDLLCSPQRITRPKGA